MLIFGLSTASCAFSFFQKTKNPPYRIFMAGCTQIIHLAHSTRRLFFLIGRSSGSGLILPAAPSHPCSFRIVTFAAFVHPYSGGTASASTDFPAPIIQIVFSYLYSPCQALSNFFMEPALPAAADHQIHGKNRQKRDSEGYRPCVKNT